MSINKQMKNNPQQNENNNAKHQFSNTEAMTFSQQTEFLKTMSLDLNKLANKLDKALSNETSETLTKFLNDKKMSNNKQSSVDWLIDKLIEHQIIKVGQTTYGGKVNYKHEILFEQAKEKHKEEIINATIYGDRFEGCYGLDSEQYYNRTYGGKK